MELEEATAGRTTCAFRDGGGTLVRSALGQSLLSRAPGGPGDLVRVPHGFSPWVWSTRRTEEKIISEIAAGLDNAPQTGGPRNLDPTCH